MKILREGQQFTSWAGETPYYVIVYTKDHGGFLIDVDEPGWMSEVEGLMRMPGKWVLLAKRTNESLEAMPVLVMAVDEGEQPYYTKHTVGIAVGPSAGATLAAYGIGKKRLDGTTDRLWVMPNGLVCGGDDVDIIGVEMLQNLPAAGTLTG